MKRLRLVGFVSAVLLTALVGQPAGQGAAATAFVGVNVIPMTAEIVLTNQTVVVRDGRIVALGAAASVQVPSGAIRVDGRGKYLMPAIAEMHAHIPSGPTAGPFAAALAERTLLLYAARGVATIRGMLGHPEHLKFRDRAARGELVSPRIYTSGPSFNGNSAPAADVAVKAVEAQKAAGYDLLKIHPGVKRDVFDALAAKAHELKIPFAGHVPLDVGLQRALEARYRSIDHVDGYVELLSDKPMTSEFFGINLVNGLDESKIPALVDATKKAGTWIVATQVLFDNLVGPDAPEAMAKWPDMEFAEPAGVVQKWIAQKQTMMKYSAADREKFLTVRRRIIKALHDGGVPFALGSDAPQWWNVPGFSTHRELQSMVRAGLTPYQALRTGTVNIGTYFGTPDLGTVANGQRADLMLLEANPLQDISHTLRITGVTLNGRWIPRAEFDKLLGLASGS